MERIDQHRVTLASVVPTQLERLLALSDWNPSSLRALIVGGARVPLKLIARARARKIPVLTTYGMTETASQITLQPLSDATLEPTTADSGVALPGVEWCCINGFLNVRGPMLFDGYVGEDLSPFHEEGWFCTGDRAQFKDGGRLQLIGRREDRIITGGENVAPAEVEAALEACPGIEAACVFGVADELWGEKVAAAILTSHHQPLSLEILHSFLAKHLASFKRPRWIVQLPSFDYQTTGKIDRQATAMTAKRLLNSLKEQ